jgi:hypothetical protein
MLVEQDVFNKKQFLELFQKRFFSFCEKSPLFIRFTMLEDRVLVYDLSRSAENKPFEHIFDFQISEKENIKIIKDKLVNESYPVITVNKPIERSLDALEIQELMFKGKMSFSEATSKKHIINKVEKYRVEKILNSDNKVIIRDLQNDEVWMYEVKIPVVIFVRELFLDGEKSADVFLNKCRKYKRVIDKKEA